MEVNWILISMVRSTTLTRAHFIQSGCSELDCWRVSAFNWCTKSYDQIKKWVLSEAVPRNHLHAFVCVLKLTWAPCKWRGAKQDPSPGLLHQNLVQVPTRTNSTLRRSAKESDENPGSGPRILPRNCLYMTKTSRVWKIVQYCHQRPIPGLLHQNLVQVLTQMN